MNETFIVLTADDKYGTLDPEIIGPFPDLEAAMKFGVDYLDDLGGFREPLDGGYAGVVYVNKDGCTCPEEYRADVMECRLEDAGS